ncbi:MAG: hypothetical protein AAGC46_19670 [Solirubrobacteraceae bacterium]|nr:hypothetical protein [Patulibacter sp.]
MARAYWRDVWVTMGAELTPSDAHAVGRAALLTALLDDNPTDAPGVWWMQLSKLEDALGMTPQARHRMRIQVVDKTPADAADTKSQAGLSVVPGEVASRLAG